LREAARPRANTLPFYISYAAALVSGHILSREVAGVPSTEPASFAAMIVVLMAAALLASFLPARRASQVDPMSTLRQE
jgi:ABC-type lipoprotein release transport system permease subunit